MNFATLPASRLPQPLAERGRSLAWLALLGLALLMPACAGARPTDPPQASADAAHRAWVQAVRDGDGDRAQSLADPSLPDRAQFAHDALARMRDYLTSPASPTGPLLDVTIAPMAGDEGRSVWRFARKRWCYRAGMARHDGRWYVRSWGQTSVACA